MFGIFVFNFLIPDADLIVQQLQTHIFVKVTLVFKKKIKIGFFLIDGGSKQQIRTSFFQFLADVGAILQFQIVQINGL